MIKLRPNPRQHARAHRVEDALNHKGRQHDERYTDQGWNAAAAENTVINLQHVNGPGQHQHVDAA